MNIGIVGNYGNNNKGDEAILEGILNQLEEMFQLDRDNIIVFSNQPEKTKEQYGVQSERLYYRKNSAILTMLHTMHKNTSVIKKLDLLIVGGGGIFMDLYGREAFLFGMYGWLAKLTRTPVVLYGVGAGPILTKIGKILLRSLAHLSDLVSVRDPKSKELLQSIGVKSPIHVIGDPAFQIEKPTSKRKKQASLKIGVTAVPFYNKSYWPEENKAKYENYVQGMVSNLDALVQKYPDSEIHFFSTKYPQDVQVTEEIKERMIYKDNCTVKRYLANPGEITQFAADQDIVIGTRLHSLILALVSGTPVISVSYHHKVQDFMEMVDMQHYSIAISDLHQQKNFFLQSVERMIKDWPKTEQEFAAVGEDMRLRAFRGMQYIKEQVIQERKQPKVLVLSNMYPSKRSKTFGIFVRNQVELLRERGIKADVIAIRDPRKGKFLLLKKYGLFFLHNLIRFIWKGWRYDAVHIHYIFPTGIVGLWYKRLYKKKLVVTSHGGDIDQMLRKSGIIRQLSETILQKADDVIVVGEGLKTDIKENFQLPDEKVSVINMGVNRSIFRPISQETARRQIGIPHHQKIILFVGNLIEAKGVNELAEATNLLTEQHEDVVTHMIGEPKDPAFFETFSKKYTSDHLKIHDSVNQEQLSLWFSAADVFVLPSHMEGFGLVALEAMACNVPVVGSDVGGLTHLLEDDAGLKVEPKNAKELADSINLVFNDANLAATLIENGKSKAQRFDQNRLVQSIIEIYKT